MRFSARAVITTPCGRAASTAAATRSVASPIGWIAVRLQSSTDAPAVPASAAAVIVAATPAGSSAKQSSRSALTGSGLAAASAAVWAIASSRDTAPSARPSVAANPELVVAIAWKPSDANSFAEPASQAFGITSGCPRHVQGSEGGADVLGAHRRPSCPIARSGSERSSAIDMPGADRGRSPAAVFLGGHGGFPVGNLTCEGIATGGPHGLACSYVHKRHTGA